MTLTLPQEKVNAIIDQCQLFLSRDQVTMWAIAQLIGKLSYSAAGVLPAPLHYRCLQRHPQQIFVRPSQKQLGLPSSEWDHDYCRVFTRNTQCGSKSSVKVGNGFQRMETEPTYFQTDLQSFLDSGHRPFHLKNTSSSTSIFSLETGSIQQRIRPLSTILEESHGIRLSPHLSHRTSFEESSTGKCHTNFNNFGMAGTTIVPKDTSNEHSQPSLNYKGKQSFNWIGFLTTTSGGKQNVTTNGLGSFRENVFAERLSEKVVRLISDARRSGAVNHYKSSWRKWNSWCIQRVFDPTRCDLNPILGFLTEIFH